MGTFYDYDVRIAWKGDKDQGKAMEQLTRRYFEGVDDETTKPLRKALDFDNEPPSDCFANFINFDESDDPRQTLYASQFDTRHLPYEDFKPFFEVLSKQFPGISFYMWYHYYERDTEPRVAYFGYEIHSAGKKPEYHESVLDPDDYDDFEEAEQEYDKILMEDSKNEIIKWLGFAPVEKKTAKNSKSAAKKTVAKKTAASKKSTSPLTGKLTGKSFCFTGKLETLSRSDAETKVKEKGGTIGTVNKSLTYLVTNDTSTGSAKNKKAADLGVKVIDENAFLKMVK